MSRIALLTTVLLIASLPSPADAQQGTVLDDAYVSAARPNARLGRNADTRDTLQVSPGEQAFVRFSVDLPAGTPGSHVGQATLKVFVRNVRTPGEIRIHRVTGAWSENDVTAATAPGIGAQEGAPVVITQAHERGWVTVDVSQLARDWLNNAAVNDGVALVGVGPTDIVLDSKENAATSHEPVLEILLNHAATADDAARLGGVNAGEYARTNDSRLTDARPPTPDSNHYVQNTPTPQAAQFNVDNGMVRGNLTVLGVLNAPSLNVAGSFIQNQTTQPQAGAGFNITGDGTVGGTLSGGTVNAATAFNIGGQRVLGVGAVGSSNVFLGQTAGRINTGGILNTFVGFGAGASNGDGCCNSFFGNFAGSSNTTGFANVFVGGGAGGKHEDGFRNTLIGDLAGNDLFEETGLSTGNRNTFVGSVSGRRIATGSSNTFVGVDTTGTPDIQFASAFGSNATVTTNDTIVIGKAAGTYYGVERPADTVTIPGSLNVAGALTLNIVDAATQFNVAGQRVLHADVTGNNNLFLGWLAGQANGGRGNTFLGSLAGQTSTGEANTFLGNRAGRGAGGNSNTFIGSIAGFIHLTGDENTFVGDGSGSDNIAGSFNSFYGVDAGRGTFQSAPERNSFFGTLAGRDISTGADNAAFGYRAGVAIGSSTWNAFLGAYAGENTTSSYNAFFGSQAGRQNVTGQRNAFFGTEAGSHNVDGDDNVFVGVLAGVFNTSGVANTFVGTNAGRNNQGSRNTLLGADSDVGADNLTYATAIGAGAIVETSDTVVLGRAGDTVRIPGSLSIAGTFDAATFTGNGAGLTNLDAGQITTGTLPNARLGLIPTGNIADSAVTSAKIAGGQVVKSLNGLTDHVTLAAGANVTIMPAGNTLTIAATGGGGGLSAPALLNLFGGPGAGANTTPNVPVPNFHGIRNTFLGNQAGAGNTEGSFNTFVGAEAGLKTRTGRHNTVVGAEAGLENVAGESNSFFGSSAGGLTTGSRNSFFGAAAGELTLGSDNTFIGSGSGTNSTNASDNAFLGSLAGGDNTLGSRNVFLGRMAGLFNSSGADNTFVGYRAGDSVRTTAGNTALGANADVAVGLTNATAIGANAVANQSNALVLGNNADVGIGSSAPKARLDVRGGDILVGSPGQGIVLRSPDGGTCRVLRIANGTGDLTLAAVECPQ